MKATTKAQRCAMKRLYDRYMSGDTHDTITYREWRKGVKPAFGIDCLMVQQWGMWIGIERDGHTHS